MKRIHFAAINAYDMLYMSSKRLFFVVNFFTVLGASHFVKIVFGAQATASFEPISFALFVSLISVLISAERISRK